MEIFIVRKNCIIFSSDYHCSFTILFNIIIQASYKDRIFSMSTICNFFISIFPTVIKCSAAKD